MNDADILSKSKFRKPIFIAIVLALLIFIIAYFYTSTLNRFLIDETQDSLKAITIETSSTYENYLTGDFNTITSIATYIGETSSDNILNTLPVLKVECERNNFKHMGIVTPEGVGYTSDGIVFGASNQNFFTQAMEGENVVSDIINDTSDGEAVSLFASPIYSDNTVIGVIFVTNSVNYYKEELSNTSFEEKGYAYIIRDDGSVLFRSQHPNNDKSFESISVLSYIDGGSWQNISTALKNDENGVATFERNGQTYYMSFSSIKINNWNILLVVPKSVVSEKTNQLIVYTLLTWFIILLFFTALIIYLQKNQKKSRMQLANLAYIDRVTGFSNWNKFTLESEALLSFNHKKHYAMVVFDIDKFKVINDLYGFQKGNILLTKLAKMLSDNTNSDDEAFCRSSSDDFALLLTYDSEENLLKRIETLKEKLTLKEFDFSYSLSFGVYTIEEEQLSINHLFDRADLARKFIKSTGNGIASFDTFMRKKILKETEIEAEMENALAVGQFKVYLQPKYSLKTLKAVGAEALVRWQHPQKGLIPPDEFIPLFEKNNFILKLDYFMFRSICKKQKEWTDMGLEPLLISVNFSRNHLNNPKFPDNLLKITKEYNIPPNCLELEITESAIFDNMKILTSVFKELKDYGFKISIDDFGSGYSSLNLLKELPVDVLKMDKDFFSEADISIRGKKVVESVILMAKALDVKVVAEGVETEDQIAFLKDVGCDIIQGYYFAKPMPVKTYEKKIYGI